jgi:hypothetical protein
LPHRAFVRGAAADGALLGRRDLRGGVEERRDRVGVVTRQLVARPRGKVRSSQTLDRARGVDVASRLELTLQTRTNQHELLGANGVQLVEGVVERDGHCDRRENHTMSMAVIV